MASVFSTEGSSRPETASREQAPPQIAILGADSLFVDAVSPRLESLGMHVQASNGALNGQATKLRPEPDLVLLDADGDDTDEAASLVRELPNTKRILMSSQLDEHGVRSALQQGFHGAISKDIPIHRFQSAILSVMDGDVVVEMKPVRREWMSEDEGSDRILAVSLTDRERETLALLVEGVSGPEMASRMSVSPHTVRTHVQNVMSKLQVHSRVEAAAFAVRHGIVQPGITRRAEAER
jgi:two-component system, NarL family, nitrate/nitrite response regulator NarL